MLLTHAGIELLRLTGWCRNIPTGLGEKFGSTLYSPDTLSSLLQYGFLKISRDQGGFMLTNKGWSLLQCLGFPARQESKPPSKYKLTRRMQGAQTLLTFHRARSNVFGSHLADLAHPNIYLSSAPVRRYYAEHQSNVFAGARFAGYARIENDAYLVHYADMGRMYYKSETHQFTQAVYQHSCHTRLLLAGETYSDIVRIISSEPPSDGKRVKNNAFSYHKVLRMATMPVHLLECSDDGALQLLAMGRKDHRTVLAHALFKDNYMPPHAGVQESDGSFPDAPYHPFVIALDMDVNRIARVCDAAEAEGFSQVALFSLKSQRASLEALFGNRIVALYFSSDFISDELGNLSLYMPSPEPYITREGGVLNASTFLDDSNA